MFNMGGGKTIQKIAEEKGDEKLLTRIRGKCLLSRSTLPCIKPETVHKVSWIGRSEDEEKKQKQFDHEEAHSQAFEKIRALVQERVVQQN